MSDELTRAKLSERMHPIAIGDENQLKIEIASIDDADGSIDLVFTSGSRGGYMYLSVTLDTSGLTQLIDQLKLAKLYIAAE